MVPGQEPFGKEAFCALSHGMKSMEIDGTSEVQELQGPRPLGIHAQPHPDHGNSGQRRRTHPALGLHAIDFPQKRVLFDIS
jgi:hypothetical protein